MFPLELKHNHAKDAQLEGTISSPVMAVHDSDKEDTIGKARIISDEVIVVSTAPAPKVEAQQLKDKMKQRFAALSLDLSELKK